MLKLVFLANEKFNMDTIQKTNTLIKNALIHAEVEYILIHDAYEMDLALRNYADEPNRDVAYVFFICGEYNGCTGYATIMKIRVRIKEAYIVFMSDQTEDLIELINNHAGISGFLKYNYRDETLNKIISSIYANHRDYSLKNEQQFVLLVGKKMHKFPINEIFYFESLNKKIYMSTLNAQFNFYDSLTSLGKRLPGSFLRCHNSYLINTSMIEKISLKELTITLRTGIKIPISQKFKSNIIKLIESIKLQTS